MSKTNLVWVLAAVCLGCTSTNDPIIAAVDAGADAKRADGGTGTKADGGPITDNDSGKIDEDSSAPVPCTPISGGLPCDAKKVYCGSSNCDSTTEDCCVDTQTGASACVAKGSCTSTSAGLGCDEAGDCAAGEVCCFSASGTTPTGALCQTGPCGFGDYSQSCRSDTECAGSGSCGSGSCAGYKIQTCAPIPSTACGN